MIVHDEGSLGVDEYATSYETARVAPRQKIRFANPVKLVLALLQLAQGERER